MSEDFDSADLDALKELRRAPGYALVAARIRHEIERKRDELEHQQISERDSSFTRGYIRALRTVLDYPQILMDEVKQ